MTEKDKKHVKFLQERYFRYRDNISTKVSDWKYYYRVAKAQADVGVRGYQHNVNRHICLMFVESFASSVLNPIFSMRQLVNVEPAERMSFIRPDLNDVEIAKQLNLAINYLFDHPDTRLSINLRHMVKSLGYFGTAVAQIKPGWRKKPDGMYEYKGPLVHLEQIYNILPNPFIDELMPGVDLFIREVITPAELKLRAKSAGYKNIKQALAAGDTDSIDTDIKRELEQVNYKSTGSGPDRKMFLVHYFDSDGGLRIMANNEVLVYNSADGKKITLPDGSNITVAAGSAYPYYPFESLKINEAPREFWGTGIVELSAETQQMMNRRASQRNENIELGMSQPMIASRYAGIETDDLMVEPGKLIWVNEIDGITPLNIPDFTRNAYAEDESDMRFTQDIVSIPEVVRGISPPGRTTATETTQNMQSAMERMSTLQQDVSRTIISIARKTAVQIRTWMQQQEYERLIGRPDAGLFRMTNDEIEKMIDYLPVYKPLNQQDKAMRMQNLMTILQTSAQLPFVNTMAIFQDIVSEFFPKTDPNRYVMPPPAVGQELGMQQLGQPTPMGAGITPPSRQPAPGLPHGDFKSQNPEQTAARVGAGGQA